MLLCFIGNCRRNEELVTMFNVNTVIGINSAMSRPSGSRKKDRMDYRKELQEIIKMVDAAKLRLGNVSCAMDS